MSISENIEVPTQKKQILKNLIEAHGWLGVITSIVLFLVFWAGALSLFRAEIQQWAELPHHPVNNSVADKPLIDIIQEKLKEYPLNTKEHLSISMPGEHTSYYRMSIDLLPKEGQPTDKEEVVEINVDPKTGATVGRSGQFHLADFLYQLHYGLNLSQAGLYFVGLVTLIFLVAIFSGVYIHAKKIFSNFFSYRTRKQRTHLLDLHNLAGVISLPYILMYAITGLIFNLIIVFQLVAVVFLYKGDTLTLFKDVDVAGYQAVAQSGVPQDMSAAIPLIEKTRNTFGPVNFLQFYNYGDQNAVIRVQGNQPNYFIHYYDIYYQVRDGSIVQQYGLAPNNTYRRGMEVIGAFHFASYAGIDLRFIYFLLAMAVATMIIAGNLLWITKRANQPNYQRFTYIIGNLTLGGCSGIILATSVSFLLERALPAEIESRAFIVHSLFTLTLLLTTIGSFLIKAKKPFLGTTLYITSTVIFLILLCDLLVFRKPILELLKLGNLTVVGIDSGLFMFALGFILIGGKLLKPQSTSLISNG